LIPSFSSFSFDNLRIRSSRAYRGQVQAGTAKLHFADSGGRPHRFLAITDLGFYDYAQRHRESGALRSLNEEIAAQEQVFLRIGLSRNYMNPQGKEGFWLQANGIYTFPNVLRYIRSYPGGEARK
jgi:hypothetical protein